MTLTYMDRGSTILLGLVKAKYNPYCIDYEIKIKNNFVLGINPERYNESKIIEILYFRIIKCKGK